MSKWVDNEEIQILREYLQIPSVQPNVDYEPCVSFLKKQASNLNLPVSVVYPANERCPVVVVTWLGSKPELSSKPCVAFLRRQAKNLDLPVSVYYPVNDKNPIVVLTWVGAQPELPSIILNSHMDVVPVFPEYWTHPPFAADIDDDGKIFARGAQDMKSVGMQYLAAIRALKRDGVIQLKRTIHVVFVPDEEVGGYLGMHRFVTTDEFKALNVGFSLDEGIASPTEAFNIYYAERTIWQIEFVCHGQSGHGSMLLKKTPGEKINYIIDKLMKFRKGEEAKLENNPELDIGDVTTINLTILNGGTQGNVVPPEMSAAFDIRLANDRNFDEFEKLLNQWCAEAGGNIEINIQHKNPKAPITATDSSNPYWVAFKSAIDELNLKVKKLVFPGGTDSRYIRRVNNPALGFSPLNNVPVLLHDHDEYVEADTYLTGIKIYMNIIPKLANA